MEIIIGRKGTQRTPITDATVSREHCRLTVHPDGSMTLENLSQSGTSVDGRSIIKTSVTPDTIIQLGAQFKIAIKDILPIPQQKVAKSEEKKAATVDTTDYTRQFMRLRDVYDKYSAEKIAIQKEAGMANFYRMLPMTLLSLIGLGAAAIPALGSVAPFIAVAGIGLLTYSLVKSYNGSKENPERMEALNRQFMIDYVCPKCGNFLGFVPFEMLQNKRQCNLCKCQWV